MDFFQILLPGQEFLIHIERKHKIAEVFIGLVVKRKEGLYGLENFSNGTLTISPSVIIKVKFPGKPAPDVFNSPDGLKHPDRLPQGFNQMESFWVQTADFKGMQEQVYRPELVFPRGNRAVLPEAIVIEPVIRFRVF